MRISDWSSDVCSSDLEHKLREEAEDERFTSHDRSLLREADADGVVRSGGGDDRFRQTLRAARLQKLRRLGLAEEIAPRRWRLVDDLEQVLCRIGERGDILQALHRAQLGRAAGGGGGCKSG